MEISTFVRPRSLDEAYALLTEKKAYPLGGGAWSRMLARRVETVVDLSVLDLRYIRKTGTQIEMGAMTTARDIEVSETLREAFGPLCANTVGHIVGVQLRNIISVGGTVAGRYGFSDLNTTLLAMDAKILLYREGETDFETFLRDRRNGPFLIEKIILETRNSRGAYQSVRNTNTDFPILNAAAGFAGGKWRIAVGGRPGSSRLAAGAMELLGSEEKPGKDLIEKAAERAAGELTFGSDLHGSGEYRKSVCLPLVKRAITEAAK
jgi:CO/xanthine dehydrogenase FAD-binding subunit